MNRFLVNRRRLLASAGLFAPVSLALAAGDSEGAGRKSPQEVANEALVNDFCAAWSKMDVEVLMPFLAPDVIYQMFEGRPDLIGAEAFRKMIGPFFSTLASVQWDMLRSCVVGPIVINERIDRFIALPGGRDRIFPIAGLFVVKDARIVLWRDYSMPKV